MTVTAAVGPLCSQHGQDTVDELRSKDYKHSLERKEREARDQRQRERTARAFTGELYSLLRAMLFGVTQLPRWGCTHMARFCLEGGVLFTGCDSAWVEGGAVPGGWGSVHRV